MCNMGGGKKWRQFCPATYPYRQGFFAVFNITECNKPTFRYGFALWGTAFVIECSRHHFTIAVTEQILSCAYKISCKWIIESEKLVSINLEIIKDLYDQATTNIVKRHSNYLYTEKATKS